MTTKKSFVYVTFTKEGYHYFPEAGTDKKYATGDMYDVSHLANKHMHYFYFKVWVEVKHANRDIEFIQLRRWLENLYSNGTLQLNNKSCEMISDDLHLIVADRYPHSDIIIDVSEDNINGSHITYPAAVNAEPAQVAISSQSSPKQAKPSKLPTKQSVNIYCDGSAKTNPGEAGWAFVVEVEGNIKYGKNGYLGVATNNQAELQGFISACEWAIANGQTNAMIHSDSQYIVNGYTEWMKSWEKKNWEGTKNVEYWKEMARIKKTAPNIKVRWVKAHNGNGFNEVADELAKMGADKKFYDK